MMRSIMIIKYSASGFVPTACRINCISKNVLSWSNPADFEQFNWNHHLGHFKSVNSFSTAARNMWIFIVKNAGRFPVQFNKIRLLQNAEILDKSASVYFSKKILRKS